MNSNPHENHEWVVALHYKPNHFNLVPVLIGGLKMDLARWNSFANGWFKEGDNEKRVNVTHWFNLYI